MTKHPFRFTLFLLMCLALALTAVEFDTVVLEAVEVATALKATFEGHIDGVRSVAFSPEGSTLASGSGDGTVRLWDVATGHSIAELTGHTAQARSVAFSSDGSILANGSHDSTVRLWDVDTRQLKATLTGHTAGVESIAFSPEGQVLASGSHDSTVRLWDVVTGQLMDTLTVRPASVWSVAFDPNGNTLAIGDQNGTILLQNMVAGGTSLTLTGHTAWVESVAFSPDGSTLASGSGDSTVRLWDVSTGQSTATLTGHTAEINSVAFSPDGATLASGSDDSTVRLWDTATGQFIETLTGHTSWVRSVAFSPDGSTLASGSGDGTVRLWEFTSSDADSPSIDTSSFAAISEVVISAETIRDFGETSPQNTAFVRDADASNGLAFQFTGGANNPPVANPTAWWEVEFWCEAGTYYIWARGKSDGGVATDAFWLQFDDQIGTTDHTADPDFVGFGLGNWRDVFDAGIYKWISQGILPLTVVEWTTNRTGLHRVRAQARQVPHYLDQLLISQHQNELPADTAWPTEFPRRDPRIATNEISAIDTEGMQIYWIGKGAAKGGVAPPYKGVGKIQRANLDGTNVQDLITDLAAPWHIALDVAGGKMYWADWSEIKRANLDGTNVQNLITDLEHPQGIALDVAGGKIYYTVMGKIQCANLDGTNVQNLVTSVQVPTNVALDVVGGKMYWADWVTEKIQCANLDGTNVQDLVTGVESVWHIALDVVGGKMYWTNWITAGAYSDKIQCANLDGTNVQDLVTGLAFPHGIALDVAGGKIYYTIGDKIQSVNLDGTNVQNLVTGVNPFPWGIALAISPDLPPARADVNQDGKVNIIDLLLVVSTLGDTAPALLFGDVNEDNKVTIDDVLLVIEALDDPVTAAAPSNNGRILPLEGATFEAPLNRLRSQSDGSLKYQRAIAFFQNLLASVAPPDRTELLANYPNPFNPETWIPYRLAEDAFVTLTIYDLEGHIIRTLNIGHRIAASYESRSKAIYWDGRNELGEQVASGVYFYHLSAGTYSDTRRMVILK